MNISLSIADPSFLIREGLKRVIEESNISLISEIKNHNDFWSNISLNQPDVLIVDYDSKNFIETSDLTRVLQIYPEIRLLVISDDNNKDTILNTVKTGITGYLTKECGKEEIITAINTVAKGDKFFCNKILDVILEKHIIPGNSQDSPELSEREIEITKMITKGMSNKEIADTLFLSIHTVYTHRKNIMRKLNIKSPVELVLYAMETGLIGNEQ